MTRPSSFQEYRVEDYPETPPWFRRFLEKLNRDLREINRSANENSEVVEVTLEDGVSKKIRAPTMRGAPVEVRLIQADVAPTSFNWTQSEERGAIVTATFTGSPASPVGCRVKLEGSS